MGFSGGRRMLPTNWLEILRREYPRRDGDNGWIHVRTLVPRACSAGCSWDRILAGTRAYRAHCDRKGLTGTEMVKQARTFYGPTQYFDEWADMEPVKSAQQVRDEVKWGKLKARAAACGFREPWPVDSPDTYETALREHERTVVPLRQPA